jgi:hypothetical protein
MPGNIAIYTLYKFGYLPQLIRAVVERRNNERGYLNPYSELLGERNIVQNRLKPSAAYLLVKSFAKGL